MHRSTESKELLPIAVPIKSPRNVSMNGVNGWNSAASTGCVLV
jgi:hypothetical protein